MLSRMPELICEIWRDDDNGSFEGGQISADSDRVRKVVSPNSTLLHTYAARSSFELFRKYHEWLGHEPWSPPEGIADHPFSEEEAEEQRLYLAVRDRG